jgi:hypothetical protein
MITLNFTPEQIQQIGLCLTKAPIPYEITHPLITEINRQIAEQQKLKEEVKQE